MDLSKIDYKAIDKICDRALYFSTQMIYMANNRKNKAKGDPKIGGHPSACSSYLHIAAALHLVMKTGFDHIAVKPHAAPMDHVFNYFMDLFLDKDLERFDDEKAKKAMEGLRAYSQNGEPVLQSYHSAYDPDHHNFLPSGTVGIPPVNLGYLAHAYRLLKDHGYEVPEDAHFWAVMGDSEYREGSLQEALPDFAERELGNITWIVDYNRQSLDGHRITNKEIMEGTDNERIARCAKASGWEVIQVRHGKKRQEVFKKKGGKEFQRYFEDQLDDLELQTLLRAEDMKKVRDQIHSDNNKLAEILDQLSDKELQEVIRDMGGHDVQAISEAMLASKQDTRRPTLIIIHTIKGWGLQAMAAQANHNTLPNKKEVDALRESRGIPADDPFQKFDKNSAESKFLANRGDQLYDDIMVQEGLMQQNKDYFEHNLQKLGDIPDAIDVNYKMASYPHTQWMFGQLTSKLNRISNTPLAEDELLEGQKPLTEAEKAWKLVSELVVSMAPDVGTSTNLNPSMDGQIYDPDLVETDYELEFNLKDTKSPDLIPNEDKKHKFIRFEIEESNTTSCVGSYGRIRDVLGIPVVPIMTIYDFFVKRAMDQHFYNLYWKSSFIMVGTPAGVTLSPEGAQHGWKSDIQIPNQITWEPYFCQELDWILADSIRRHVLNDNEGRTGVHIRTVTRGAEQKDLMKYLKMQARFKSQDLTLSHSDYPLADGTPENQIEAISDEEIYSSLKQDVLKGAYYLINYENYAGYTPGDNVVNIFAMGAPTTEAIKASNMLLQKGIYANVIVVTSSDLLCGIQGHEDNYSYLKNGLNIDNRLQILPDSLKESYGDLITVAGRKVPIVSVHDGEAGLLDNLGSILGVRHECLAVRKHSKCGRPQDVYAYHGIDEDAIVEATGKVLSETALEGIQIHRSLLEQASHANSNIQNWRELWPEVIKN